MCVRFLTGLFVQSRQDSYEVPHGDESLLLTYIAREDYALAVEVLLAPCSMDMGVVQSLS